MKPLFDKYALLLCASIFVAIALATADYHAAFWAFIVIFQQVYINTLKDFVDHLTKSHAALAHFIIDHTTFTKEPTE